MKFSGFNLEEKKKKTCCTLINNANYFKNNQHMKYKKHYLLLELCSSHDAYFLCRSIIPNYSS